MLACCWLSAALALGALNVTEETSRVALPSATGFAARQAIAVLRKHNVPIDPLLKRAGVAEGDIDNRQRRISAMAQGKLLEYAAEALGDSVGLEGLRRPNGVLDLAEDHHELRHIGPSDA